MPAAFPSSQNVFVRNHEASGKLVIDFARNPNKFALNRYVQVIPVKQVAGYYLKMTVEEAGRIQQSDLKDFIWYDGDPAPEGRDNLESHAWLPFSTTRYAYPVPLGHRMIAQASWDMIAQYSSIKARQAMTARTQKVINVLTTAGNWDASHTIDVEDIPGMSGNWSQSTVARQDLKRSLEYAALQIMKDTLSAVEPEEDLHLVIGPEDAAELSQTQEIVDHIKHSPEALAQVKGELKGRNTIFGLPDKIYGFPLEIEKTVKVTSKRGATAVRQFILPKGSALLLARPGALEGVAGAPSFSTVSLFAYEEMTAETLTDPNNRRTQVRVVEDIEAYLTASASGFYFQNVSL